MNLRALRTLLVAAAALLGTAAAPRAVAQQAAPWPAPRGFVNDFADRIAPAVRTRLEEALRGVRGRASVEIAVVTVDSLRGKSVEEYTRGLANQWGVGDRMKDDGVVLLVAPNERKVRIEVGIGLTGRIPDAAAKGIIDRDILPRFRQGDLQGGVLAGVDGILAALGEAPLGLVEPAGPAGPPAAGPPSDSGGGLGLFLWAILAVGILFPGFFLVVVLVKWLRGMDRSHTWSSRAPTAADYAALHTMRTMNTMNSTGGMLGGGGFGSGGIGGAGGFGGFGGGSFGGGGASGSW